MVPTALESACGMEWIMKEYRKNNKIFRLFFLTVIGVIIAAGFGIYAGILMKKIPRNIYVENNKTTTLELNLPVTGDNVIQTVDFNKPVTFVAGSTGTYKMDIKLFGVFDISTVNVNVVEQKNVYPCGFQTGLYMKTDGVLVVGTENIEDSYGNLISPCENVIRTGDYISAVNGNYINRKDELIDIISEFNGGELIFTVRRNESDIDVSIRPVRDTNGDYKVGLWVKDDAQGIGTVTYIDEGGRFGALGHGITDTDTDKLLDISDGALYRTNIISIIKGEDGTPGEFVGTIDYKKSNVLGEINSNRTNGIYGTIDTKLIEEYDLKMMSVGYSYETHKGTAAIRMYVKGEFKEYPIIIEELSNNESKNITFRVVSEELLELTNGIVQGMSGCPIIQDGKIIGAVTHVFIDNSKCGYGIYMEKMME